MDTNATPGLSCAAGSKVRLDGELATDEIERMMDNSYTLVMKSLPKNAADHGNPSW